MDETRWSWTRPVLDALCFTTAAVKNTTTMTKEQRPKRTGSSRTRQTHAAPLNIQANIQIQQPYTGPPDSAESSQESGEAAEIAQLKAQIEQLKAQINQLQGEVNCLERQNRNFLQQSRDDASANDKLKAAADLHQDTLQKLVQENTRAAAASDMAMARTQERVEELEGCLADREATATLWTTRIAELEIALANKKQQLADGRSSESAAAVGDAGISDWLTRRVKELEEHLTQAHADRDALSLALEQEKAAHKDARADYIDLTQALSKSMETASKHEITIIELSRKSASNDAEHIRWRRLAHALQRHARSFNLAYLELKPPMAPAGLERFGLTCYINAVLHCLAHTKFLTHISAARDDTFAMALAELLVAIRNGDTSRFHREHSALAYYRYEQDDALQYFSWLVGTLEPTRVPMAVFGMEEISTRTCSGCPHSSSGSTPILYITVEPCDSVVEALNIAHPALGKEETVQRNCDECGPLYNHKSHTVLARAPPVVVVNMPCYDPNGLVEAKIVIKKPAIELSIEFQAATYELVAVVVHEGVSRECGHYVAYVRSRHNAPDSKYHTWYKMDDDHPVQSVTTDTVKTLQGTMFFYERSDETATASGTDLKRAITVRHGRNKRPKSPAIDDPAPKKPRHTRCVLPPTPLVRKLSNRLVHSNEAPQGGSAFGGDQPGGYESDHGQHDEFEFGDGQQDDYEFGGSSPAEETKEPESSQPRASRRPGGAASPEVSWRDFFSTRRDAMLHLDAFFSEAESFVVENNRKVDTRIHLETSTNVKAPIVLRVHQENVCANLLALATCAATAIVLNVNVSDDDVNELVDELRLDDILANPALLDDALQFVLFVANRIKVRSHANGATLQYKNEVKQLQLYTHFLLRGRAPRVWLPTFGTLGTRATTPQPGCRQSRRHQGKHHKKTMVRTVKLQVRPPSMTPANDLCV